MGIPSRSVLITDGAGGFGGATAKRMAKLGAKVVITDVADERDEALAREIGGAAAYVRTDILDEASIMAAVEKAASLAPLRAAVIAHGGSENRFTAMQHSACLSHPVGVQEPIASSDPACRRLRDIARAPAQQGKRRYGSLQAYTHRQAAGQHRI